MMFGSTLERNVGRKFIHFIWIFKSNILPSPQTGLILHLIAGRLTFKKEKGKTITACSIDLPRTFDSRSCLLSLNNICSVAIYEALRNLIA